MSRLGGGDTKAGKVIEGGLGVVRCNPGPDDQGPPMGCVSGVLPAGFTGMSFWARRRWIACSGHHLIGMGLRIAKFSILTHGDCSTRCCW